jgi:hypothetical protein
MMDFRAYVGYRPQTLLYAKLHFSEVQPKAASWRSCVTSAAVNEKHPTSAHRSRIRPELSRSTYGGGATHQRKRSTYIEVRAVTLIVNGREWTEQKRPRCRFSAPGALLREAYGG